MCTRMAVSDDCNCLLRSRFIRKKTHAALFFLVPTLSELESHNGVPKTFEWVTTSS